MVGYIIYSKLFVNPLYYCEITPLSKRVFMPNILKKKEGDEMRLSKSCCVYGSYCRFNRMYKTCIDDPKDETEISNEIIHPIHCQKNLFYCNYLSLI